MSIWSEIRNDFYDDIEGCICIDAWHTSNDNEEGIIIAKVFKDRIEYLDKDAVTDTYAKEKIEEAKKLLLENN